MLQDPEQLCQAVLGFMAAAEMEAVCFQRALSLSCPPGCGGCCRDDHPEDSPLSCLPAARWAIDNGMVDRIEEAASERPDGPCVFYDVDRQGHCAVYPLRPLICRLFGFSGRRDKYGRPTFNPCRRMPVLRDLPDVTPPILSDYSLRLHFVYPPLGQEIFGINLAVWRAVEWLLLRDRLSAETEESMLAVVAPV